MLILLCVLGIGLVLNIVIIVAGGEPTAMGSHIGPPSYHV